MREWKLTQQINFEGREVRYGIEGSGPALILVHGTPWSSFNLRHLISGLSDSFTVYYFDLLGYGQSDKSDADVCLGIQNKLTEALLNEWQLNKPFVVGHDFGGTTVLRNHILNERAYEKITVIDPVALSPWGSPFFKHVRKYEVAFAGVPDYIHEAIVKAYVQTAAYKPIDNETLDEIVRPWTGTEGKAAFYRQIAQADSKYTDEIQAKYNTIIRPVLILWGEEDKWIPVEQAHSLHQLIPNSKLVTVPQAGHLVIEECPEMLVREIKDFLKEREKQST
jgi:pimeloyl-ACP methyl ester carboxylesterase